MQMLEHAMPRTATVESAHARGVLNSPSQMSTLATACARMNQTFP